MRKYLLLMIVVLGAMPGMILAQSVIADQQFTLHNHVFRLKTYEKTADGYRNLLLPTTNAEEDQSASFSLIELDATIFHQLFWMAADSLLGPEKDEFQSADYAISSELFGGIVLAVNSGDERPVAGRLTIAKTILGYRQSDLMADAEAYFNPSAQNTAQRTKVSKREWPKYFLNSRSHAYYQYIVDSLKHRYDRLNGGLVTLGERIAQTRAEITKYTNRSKALGRALTDTIPKQLNAIQQRIDDFDANRKPLLTNQIMPEAEKTVAQCQEWLSLLEANRPGDSLALHAIPAGKDSASIRLELQSAMLRIQNAKFELAESGKNAFGIGNVTKQQRLGEYQVRCEDEVNHLDSLIALRQIELSKLNAEMLNDQRLLEKDYFLVHVDSVRIEFNQGMLERITAVTRRLANDGTKLEQLVFTNVYPIGFSTFLNYSRTIEMQMLVESSHHYMVPVADLISYIPNVRLNTRDFSPSDTAMTFYPEAGDYVMRKEPRSEVLKAKVFTDLVGLDENQPNGLVQMEIEKRINLYTWRRPLFSGTFLNTSFAQFVRPIATLSKIDGKLRQAPVNIAPAMVGPQVELRKNVLNIDLLRYEYLSTGADLNVWMLDSQPWKFTFFANFGARFGRLSFTDSLRTIDSTLQLQNTGIVQDFGVNTFRMYPEAQFMFFPDESFNFGISYRTTYLRMLSNDLLQIPDRSVLVNGLSDIDARRNRWVHTFEAAATLRLSDRGELYARYRLHIQKGYADTNFHQAQIGYSMSITRKVAGK